MSRSEAEVADDYLRWLEVAPQDRAGRRRREAPVTALQSAALADPDPFRRARCLAVLDHVANEASTDVFVAALADPVADVRRHAVHGLTCERCRTTELCLVDVVAAVTRALVSERDVETRHQLVMVLGRFASRSNAARHALDVVSTNDPDDLVRVAATSVLTTGHARSRRALQRLARTADRHPRRRA